MKLSGGELLALCSVIEQMVVQYENEKLCGITINDELFRDPPPKEDCPICMLPMPYASGMCGMAKTYQTCCGKVLCEGCVYATALEMLKGNMKDFCAFCRAPSPHSDEEAKKRYEKRMDLNDAGAFNELGELYYKGEKGFSRDVNKAFGLWQKAAELGSISAHHSLSNIYYEGKVVKQDIKKVVYHLRIAAIGGHERARHNLGVIEEQIGNMDKAMKHYMIAAKAGLDMSLKAVGEEYKAGCVTKGEYTSVLREHKESQDEMKSEQRAIGIEFTQAIDQQDDQKTAKLYFEACSNKNSK